MLAVYAWLRRHQTLVDALLAAALILTGTGAIGAAGHAPVGTFFWVAMALPVALRRRYPAGAFCVAVALGALQVIVLSYPVATDLTITVLLYTLAAYRPRRIAIAGFAVCVAGGLVAVERWSRHWHESIPPVFTVRSLWILTPVLVAWLLGDSMRWRRGYYRALEERALRLERERDAQAQIAAAAERARIARELHDVVAHNVSVMVVQADGAAYAMQTSPSRAAEALSVISATGRQALAEMRGLLGVLRSGADNAEMAPMPGVAELTGLLAQSRASGLPVAFTVEGVPRALPQGIALAAFRIVQESLTNARKHGGAGVTAAVALRFCDQALTIQVTDSGRGASAPTDGAGHGLAGMRERVEVYGGTLRYGPGPDGGFQVTASLPVPVSAADTFPHPAPAGPSSPAAPADVRGAA